MADVVLGADLGTSALKLVALDAAGAVLAEVESAYAYDSPRPGWAQAEVAAWRRALDDALARLSLADGARVRGLGFSGQMHGAVLVDAAGRAVHPALLWPDTRATAELARWQALAPADRAALANPLVPGMTGPLLAWLAQHQPACLGEAAAVVLPKDALRATLLPGSPPGVTDRSDASATLLWDMVGDAWSVAAVAAAGVPSAVLPAVLPSDEVVGSAAVAGVEVPVVVGGADTPLALLAAGASSGLLVNVGTGAQVLRPGARPAATEAPVVHTYADVDGGWYAMAALQNGGSAWAWVGEVLGMSWPELFEAASSARSGAGGVVFRPFLSGERGGVAGPDDRGGWTGLSPGTTRADLARAAVEGVVFAIADAAALLEDADEAVLLSGGGARSEFVPQLLADVLARPVRPRRLRSASAVGAALLAARGVDIEVEPRLEPTDEVQPRADARLAAAHERWREVRGSRQ